MPSPTAPKARKAAQLTPETVKTKGDAVRYVLPSGCGFQCLCCSSLSELTGLWSEIYRRWKTSMGGFSQSASRTVLRRAEGWGCRMVSLQEQGPLHLKQDMGSDQSFDPTIPIGRKNPQPVHPETPQPAKTLAQFRLLMFKPPFLSGMGSVWASAPISGALALVLFVFPCPFLSLQHPQGPRFSPSLNVAVGFLECWSLQRCRKRDCKMVCVLQPAEPTLQF